MASSLYFYKKKGMRTLLTATAITLLLQTAVSPVAGIAFAAPAANTKVTSANSTAIYKSFQNMLYKKNGLPAADRFLESKISQVTPYHATLMVLQLENARFKALTAITDRMLVPNVQDQMQKIYNWNNSFTQLMSRTKDTSLRSLLQQARDSGYRLTMIEGYLYPIMNYAAFEKYTSYVNEDIKQYIRIMAVETSNIASEDGGLMIGYQDMLNRALNQERFLNDFPKSNRKNQVQMLMNQYTLYTFYGLDNTPLFDYDTNVMVPNAQKGYKAVLQRNTSEDSAFLKKLNAFMDVIAESKFERTEAVDKWLEQNVSRDEYLPEYGI
ncbi:hypothetical protein [Paenibacillus cucumis (ex Kampfer et al. 2016)]|uniref:SbsC C-terminal domain-containing protein n=1 Tax=Paenibacillus cucumis (ex Kampfer et al. 2016) TaxID=1776858 RepID=A0ABS7KI61_9BACL|nr:hypothetical protein [Paenibacillus cucumis (ex Kampfer et al. 2016)]MBY0203641.1 hypothetical protein [Paenibacillus cucumis (ex Kampfer et al. 2016)]